MDLSTVMHRIDCHHFSTCAQYLADIDLITRNALKYNPDQDPLDKLIRHRACELSDIAHSLIKSQLEPEFEKVRVCLLKVYVIHWEKVQADFLSLWDFIRKKLMRALAVRVDPVRSLDVAVLK